MAACSRDEDDGCQQRREAHGAHCVTSSHGDSRMRLLETEKERALRPLYSAPIPQTTQRGAASAPTRRPQPQPVPPPAKPPDDSDERSRRVQSHTPVSMPLSDTRITVDRSSRHEQCTPGGRARSRRPAVPERRAAHRPRTRLPAPAAAAAPRGNSGASNDPPSSGGTTRVVDDGWVCACVCVSALVGCHRCVPTADEPHVECASSLRPRVSRIATQREGLWMATANSEAHTVQRRCYESHRSARV